MTLLMARVIAKNIVICSLLLMVSLFSYANDTIGTTTAGGITFSRSPSIELLREELTISTDEVKVAYLFQNNSDEPITSEVFFPLPIFKQKGANADWNVQQNAKTKKQNLPFLNFSVTANGQNISYSTRTQNLLDGKDITDNLKQLGKPNTKNWMEKAKQLNFVDENGNPRWETQTTFYWTQTFPPHQPIVIEHHYQPAAGMFYLAREKDKTAEMVMDNFQKQLSSLFNINLSEMQNGELLKTWTLQQIQNEQNSDQEDPYAFFYNVDYILKTGANWAGPIKNFTLKILKPQNGAVAYNQFFSTKQINKTEDKESINLFLKNFTPQKDLNVVFGSTNSS